ncbi:DNA-directed DNA polymerase [Tanacetum coccineum]|uniref:DNA-directed DNA polymerase n=1 Tax=Tanacetum coccineum TaxID=301880 RepID=A0ABQ5EJ38_9ASTR
MNERCFAVLLNKLPLKEKDTGSFTIPCDIGNLHIDNALADLGASISLMPYSMYEKLGLGEPKPTRISLELADRSIQYPRGIAENVLIKVDKFVLPIDFVILDMREDTRIPIILGRPFPATARAMIDVFNKRITLRVGDEECAGDVVDFITWPGISLETSMMSTMDLDGVTCLTGKFLGLNQKAYMSYCNGDTPFSLTYGTEAVIAAEISMPTLRTAEVDPTQNNKALEINLDMLEERREQAAIREANSKAKMEKYYNSKVRSTSFKPGDLV